MTYAERTAEALARLNRSAAAKAEADKWRAVLAKLEEKQRG